MRMVVKPIGKILVRLNLAQGLNDQVVDGVRVTSGVEFLWDGSEEEILLYFVLSWVCRQFLRAVIDIAVGIASRHSFRQSLFSLLEPLEFATEPKVGHTLDQTHDHRMCQSKERKKEDEQFGQAELRTGPDDHHLCNEWWTWYWFIWYLIRFWLFSIVWFCIQRIWLKNSVCKQKWFIYWYYNGWYGHQSHLRNHPV